MGSELDRVMQKYSVPVSNMAQGGLAKTLGAMGRGNDSLVAHITPREALMLKYMGGSGTTNPRTGMLEFDDGNDGNGGGDGNEGGGSSEDGGPGQTAAEAEAAAAAANIDADASAGGVTSGSTPAGGWGGGDWGANVDFGGPMSGPVGGTFAGDNAQSGMANVFGNSNFGRGFAGDNAQSGMANVSGDSVTNTASDNSGGYNNAGGNEYGYNTNTGMVDAPVVTTAPVTTAPVTTIPGTTPTPPVVPPPPTVAPTPFQYQPTYGFELNRLMQQYGVSTPTMMPFAGYTTQTTPEDVRRAEYDKNVYQTYANQFSNNMANTNMYNQAQFVPEPAKFTPQYSAPIANPAYAPTNFGGIYDTYTKYFGRNPEEAGVQYWGKMGATGDALRDAILKGAQNADLEYLRSQYPNLAPAPALAPTPPAPQPGGDRYAYLPVIRPAPQPGVPTPDTGKMYTADFGPTSAYGAPLYARGGAVKTRYAEGGEVVPNTDAGNLPDEEFNRMFGNYVSSLPPQATTAAPAQAATTAASAQAAPITATGSTRLAELMNQYARPSTDYARELGEARRRSQSETEAFSNMIQQMSQRGESPTSRAEMYFRLASAFGSPTRTGMFTENLALAGKEMGEFAKGRRADESERRALALKAQELRMAGAREDLATTRALAGQEAAERRAINSKVIEAYVRSGEPQSAAGKAAVDEGLRPGTPEYQARVQQLTDLNVSRMQELVNTQQENVRLRNEASQQLSAAEMNVLNDAMQNVSTARDNLASLRQALALNPNTAPSNLTQGTLNAVRRSLGSTSPTVVNTDELVNILSRLSLNSLKETFPGAISNDERRALQEVQGINAQNLESRRRIIERAITSLETMIPRTEARIAEIRSGAFGRRTPQETATPPGGAAAPGAVTSSSPGAVTSASPGAVAPEGGR